MNNKMKFTTTLKEETIEKLEILSLDKYNTSLKKNKIIEYLVNKEWEETNEVEDK
jgi:hypothetical protein